MAEYPFDLQEFYEEEEEMAITDYLDGEFASANDGMPFSAPWDLGLEIPVEKCNVCFLPINRQDLSDHKYCKKSTEISLPFEVNISRRK